jgi:lipoate-protein ligase A
MARGQIRVLRDTYPGRPALDTAISRATLQRVARELEPESLRLYRPDAVVAFGRRDAKAPGYTMAVRAARERGFAAIERLAGGRAAVFHEATLAFAWAIPDPSAREHVDQHFDELADIMVAAFRALGIDARVGEVPGEYCPGAHSVNAVGARKLMGVGQRVIRGATHVGGVVVVGGSTRIREVLVPVYSALGLDWRPQSVGCLEEEIGSLDAEQVERAILSEFATRYELLPDAVGAETRELAEALEPDHLPQPLAAPLVVG